MEIPTATSVTWETQLRCVSSAKVDSQWTAVGLASRIPPAQCKLLTILSSRSACLVLTDARPAVWLLRAILARLDLLWTRTQCALRAQVAVRTAIWKQVMSYNATLAQIITTWMVQRSHAFQLALPMNI